MFAAYTVIFSLLLTLSIALCSRRPFPATCRSLPHITLIDLITASTCKKTRAHILIGRKLFFKNVYYFRRSLHSGFFMLILLPSTIDISWTLLTDLLHAHDTYCLAARLARIVVVIFVFSGLKTVNITTQFVNCTMWWVIVSVSQLNL